MAELESICLNNTLNLILYKKNFQKLRLCNTLIYYLFTTVSQKQWQLCGMEMRRTTWQLSGDAQNYMGMGWGCGWTRCRDVDMVGIGMINTVSLFNSDYSTCKMKWTAQKYEMPLPAPYWPTASLKSQVQTLSSGYLLQHYKSMSLVVSLRSFTTAVLSVLH